MAKKKKKEEIKTENVPKEKKSDKQLYWVLGTMVCLIAIFLIASSIIQGLNSFNHEGLKFTKEKFGQIPLFKYYYFTDTTPATGHAIADAAPRPVTVYLRGDPRKNNVPVNGEISFIGGRTVYITIDGNGLTECDFSSVALAGLASFFSQNGFPIKSAFPNETEAKENNLPYITCENTPNNVVVLVQAGDETSIVAKSENCYEITAANCEILPATEKFIVQSIIDAKERQAAASPETETQ